ncbi:Uncharacterised protein [Campylobacter hyointestinalis subsp. hyointestinalis]|uniref:Uncharacterized protein n=1 Tax=Campylobacter hyointestinalis subsp. hyointestinalis TaxID=91352 RepID=A0A9W5AT98_CAMHY|nr:hypothetical protein [Campylobacter hyointestinalis]CUU79261.1 Uncharacterised protein [Campylobacter hyointestinalis subsp. hyointestinalis]CUU83231.1 Uncharacterised protein [Campylobacter hyointestinalis subsp. hyointestinalis]CUU88686.1 Uncharacterised protein [Campylobacter hyointestinalis subsp. hyointestinalis]
MNEQDKAQILEKLENIEKQQDLILNLVLRDVVQTRALRSNIRVLHQKTGLSLKEIDELEDKSFEKATEYLERYFDELDSNKE